ncbi:hypothetical protein CWI36_0261p0010, partial [Hamiltosporidium magnivora]
MDFSLLKKNIFKYLTMDRRKKNSAGEILMCDVDLGMLSERLPPPQTFHNTNHQAPTTNHQAVVARLEWPRSGILAVQKRIATFLTEPCTLTDTTEYINLRDKFLSKIKEISMNEIGKVVVRTRKHPNELVDSKVLDLINRVVCEYAGAHVPESITEAAYIMQAAQICYDEATRKEKPRSAWKENIESKISKLVLSKDLLEKARKQ